MELLADGSGDHAYVPPLRSTVLVKVADEPIQMVSLATVTTGFGLTMISPETLGAIHPFELV
jgi:hypothetical protein